MVTLANNIPSVSHAKPRTANSKDQSSDTSSRKKRNKIKQMLSKKPSDKANEIWIDGPNQLVKQPNEIWIDGPYTRSVKTLTKPIGLNACDLNCLDCESSQYDSYTMVCRMSPVNLIEPQDELSTMRSLESGANSNPNNLYESVDYAFSKRMENKETERLTWNIVDPDSRPISLLSMNLHDSKPELDAKIGNMITEESSESCSELYSKTNTQKLRIAKMSPKTEIVRSESHCKLIDCMSRSGYNYNTLPNARASNEPMCTNSQCLNVKQKLDDLKTGFDMMIFKKSYKDMESLHKTLESILNIADKTKTQNGVVTGESNTDKPRALNSSGSNVDENIYEVIPSTNSDLQRTRLGSDSSNQYSEPYDNLSHTNQFQVVVSSKNVNASAIQNKLSDFEHKNLVASTRPLVVPLNPAYISASVPSTPKPVHTPLNQRLHNSFKLFHCSSTKLHDSIVYCEASSHQGSSIKSNPKLNKRKSIRASAKCKKSFLNRFFSSSTEKKPTTSEQPCSSTVFCNNHTMASADYVTQLTSTPVPNRPHSRPMAIPRITSSTVKASCFINPFVSPTFTNSSGLCGTYFGDKNIQLKRYSTSDNSSELSCEIGNNSSLIDYNTFSAIINKTGKVQTAASSSGYESTNRDSNDSDNTSSSSSKSSQKIKLGNLIQSNIFAEFLPES
jgi:hypothetical protein